MKRLLFLFAMTLGAAAFAQTSGSLTTINGNYAAQNLVNKMLKNGQLKKAATQPAGVLAYETKGTTDDVSTISTLNRIYGLPEDNPILVDGQEIREVSGHILTGGFTLDRQADYQGKKVLSFRSEVQ